MLENVMKCSALGKISADDILNIFSYFSQKTGFDNFMQIVSNKDTLHVMSNPVLYGKHENYHQCVVC